MTLFVGQVFMECQGKGWTETHYILSDSYIDAMTALSTVMQARVPISCVDVSFRALRVQDPTIRGDAYTGPPAVANGGYTVEPTSADPDFACRIRYHSIGFNHRCVHYLRGLPLGAFSFNPLVFDGLLDPWGKSLQDYITSCMLNTVMKVAVPGANPPFQTFSIHDANTAGATIRRAGRPFDLPRGRRVHV